MGLVAPFFHPDLKPQHRSKLVTQIKLDQVQTPKPLQQFWNKLPSTRCHILPQYDSFMTGFMTHFTINSTLPKRSEMLITSLEALSHHPLSPTERRHDFRFKIFQAAYLQKRSFAPSMTPVEAKLAKHPGRFPS